jgi:hypothetical protein
VNGLLTYDRKVAKIEPQTLRALHQPLLEAWSRTTHEGVIAQVVVAVRRAYAAHMRYVARDYGSLA